jgi:hypothetical protein
MLPHLDAMGRLLRCARRLSMLFAIELQKALYIVAMSPQGLRGLQCEPL